MEAYLSDSLEKQSQNCTFLSISKKDLISGGFQVWSVPELFACVCNGHHLSLRILALANWISSVVNSRLSDVDGLFRAWNNTSLYVCCLT